MQLHLGKMTNKELAEWFGVQVNTFSQHKRKKLEELKNYADFNSIRGGVEILSIKKDTYNRKDNKIREIYQQGFEEVRGPIDTVSNINNQIFEKYNKQLPTLSSAESGYHYAIEVRNERYGVPFKNNGSIGNCYYVWCKLETNEDSSELKYTPFNEEEQKIKEKLLTKYFGTDIEKEIMIAEMVACGEISKADAYDMLMDYKNLNHTGFMKFLKELESTIGFKIVKATKFEEMLNFTETAAITGSIENN